MGVKITFNSFVSLANETSFINNLNDNFTDLAALIDLLLSRDGTAPNTWIANMDANSNRILNLGAPVNGSDAARLTDVTDAALPDIAIPSQTGNALKVLQTDGTNISWGPLVTAFADTLLDDTDAATMRATLELGSTGTAINHGVLGGSANALTLTLGATALTDGMRVRGRAALANTSTAVTLDLDGLGTKSVVKFNSVALLVGDITGADHDLEFVYNLANDEWTLLNPKDNDLSFANFAFLDVAQVWTAQQNFGIQTLTDAANISWDLDTEQVSVVTLAGNRTLDNPTNIVPGGTYMLIVKQSGGSNTLAYDTAYLFPGGVAPTLSTAAGAIDVLTFIADDVSNMLGVDSLDFQ